MIGAEGWNGSLVSRPGICDQTGSVNCCRQQKLAELGKPESILADQSRTEHVVVSKYSLLAANIVRSRKAIFVSADPRIESVGNVQVGVVDRVPAKEGLLRRDLMVDANIAPIELLSFCGFEM